MELLSKEPKGPADDRNHSGFSLSSQKAKSGFTGIRSDGVIGFGQCLAANTRQNSSLLGRGPSCCAMLAVVVKWRAHRRPSRPAWAGRLLFGKKSCISHLLVHTITHSNLAATQLPHRNGWSLLLLLLFYSTRNLPPRGTSGPAPRHSPPSKRSGCRTP